MATYKELQAYVREKYGYTPKTCWIAHVKELSGLPIRRAPNRQGPERVEPCPPQKQGHIQEALDHFGMLELRDTDLLVIREAEREIPFLKSYASSEAARMLHIAEPVASYVLPDDVHYFHERESVYPREWVFAPTAAFLKSVEKMDVSLGGRVMRAITELCAKPTKSRGDTVKPLSGELRGKWRYRIGDYRLIYHPDEKTRTVFLLGLFPRGSAYAD